MQSYFRVFEEFVFFDLWIPDSGFRIPDSGFRIWLSGFWFLVPVSGFRITSLTVAQNLLRSRNVQKFARSCYFEIFTRPGRALI